MDEFPVISMPSDEIIEEEGYEKLYAASPEIVALLSVFYGGISIIAVIGNSLVIWVVATTRHMHTVTNMYIANLALADVTIGMFCIPFQFQAALLQKWNLPEFMCAFCPFVQVVSVNVSVFTLTAIAIDRHRAIINPLRARPTKFISKIIISTIWVISLLFAIPCAIAFRVEKLEERFRENDEIINVTRPFCTNLNLSDEQLQTYRYSLVFVQYLVPFCVISYVYIQMAVKLWGTRAPGNAQNLRDTNWLKSKKKVIKMLIIVVVVFGICWLPLQTYNILYVTYSEINEYRFINIIWFCCDWLAMSNSCYNPFIYGIYNEKFKREFNNRFSVCLCKFKGGHDYHERTMSVHTRASSVRSTYVSSSTRTRNNVLMSQSSRNSNRSNGNTTGSGYNSSTGPAYTTITYFDSRRSYDDTKKMLKANGMHENPIQWTKNNFEPLNGDAFGDGANSEPAPAAVLAPSPAAQPTAKVRNNSTACICENELNERNGCDGTCILNEMSQVQGIYRPINLTIFETKNWNNLTTGNGKGYSHLEKSPVETKLAEVELSEYPFTDAKLNNNIL